MKKLVDMGGRLESVKRIVYMEELGEIGKPSISDAPDSWTVASLQEVENLGKKASLEPELPSADDVAVIMYTSGSTGMPKVSAVSLWVAKKNLFSRNQRE
jgi:long-chain acyl-CoA synthetase